METLQLDDALGSLNEYETKHAPEQLFFQGNTSLLSENRKVSVVGSRKVSADGRKRAEMICKILVDKGIVVVSGLAEGVDTIAHQTAIDNGGQTITVVGTPLDQVYPKSNKNLFDKIKTDHLAISQFPYGYPVQPKNFPIRNKTMALISDATIIIEAGEKSGTRHQGWEALRLGRTLFLLESVATNPKLTWPKQMIEYGAQVLNKGNIDHLLDELPEYTTSADVCF